ncbi:sulfotransferase [Sphingorhabdus sp. YGSMI21]|uniref:sulfotransferase n=1 Tax=Sphingorhabdus sp. YGSMI21 TaxID=2077182 RepID=UPI0013DA74B3|nr:sulfotransferase [Sphingorhabdus sp. YGSMI21]
MELAYSVMSEATKIARDLGWCEDVPPGSYENFTIWSVITMQSKQSLAATPRGQTSSPGLKDSLRWITQAAALNAYGTYVGLGARLRSSWMIREDITWLLLATMPNSGSTAVSKLIQNSAAAVSLTPSGEGQWLVPAMSAPGRRWDPAHHPDYKRMRQIWLSRVPRLPSPSVVIEKSPPNLCRIDRIADALAPMERHVVCLTRDPFAVCASWFRRYSAAAVVRSWRPDFAGKMETQADHLRMLGRLYGEWAGHMLEARERASLTIRYECLTSNPQTLIDGLQQLFPVLSDVRVDATVSVKDYKDDTLRNMNAEQVARLNSHQIKLIAEGLADHSNNIESLGYSTQLDY